jgi:hypothetical protein
MLVIIYRIWAVQFLALKNRYTDNQNKGKPKKDKWEN